jgi:hypothetical protein
MSQSVLLFSGGQIAMSRTFHSKLVSMLVLCAAFVSSGVARGQILYAVDQGSNLLRTIDPANAGTLTSVPITLAGQSINGANGLAADPQTGALWALLRLQGQTGRLLATINPGTGVATSIGNTGDAFAGLAFHTDGTLYGVTGDGANVPESLFKINQTTGAPTFSQTLGNGDDGESIGFNSTDGLLYHGSGLSTQVFESINLLTQAVTNIPLSGTAFGEFLALTQRDATTFFLSDLDDDLVTISTTGFVSSVGPLGFTAKGLAFVPIPEPTSLALVGLAAVGICGRRRHRPSKGRQGP